jgi:hypothetical protein
MIFLFLPENFHIVSNPPLKREIAERYPLTERMDEPEDPGEDTNFSWRVI